VKITTRVLQFPTDAKFPTAKARDASPVSGQCGVPDSRKRVSGQILRLVPD